MPKSKIPDAVITEAYRRLGSVWKVADEVGLCGQSVHERLSKLGLNNPTPPEFTKKQQSLIVQLYAKGFESGDGALDNLVAYIGKSKQNICRWARKRGLTNVKRKASAEFNEKNAIRQRQMIKEKGHPRGALGMKHTPEAKAKISAASFRSQNARTPEQEASRVLKGLKTRERNGTLVTPRTGVTWKGGWRVIGGRRKYYRSRWEANYARYLEWLRLQRQISKWEHEPQTFWFEKIRRGTRSYLPDFRITRNDGTVYFLEVKGYMDSRSKTKLKRMAKYYPAVELQLVDAKAYKALAKTASVLVADWE